MKHTIRIALLALVVLLAVAVGSAFADSTRDAIYRDASDGVISGHYTLAQLRDADAHIRADQREYILWDEVYAAAVAHLTTPNAPPPTVVKPVDSNGNGKIDPDEKSYAAEKTREDNKQALIDAGKKKPKKTRTATPTGTTDATDMTDAVKNSSAKKKDDGDGPNWILIILVAIIIVIGAVGVWRVIATRVGKDDVDPRNGDDIDKRNGSGPRR